MSSNHWTSSSISGFRFGVQSFVGAGNLEVLRNLNVSGPFTGDAPGPSGAGDIRAALK